MVQSNSIKEVGTINIFNFNLFFEKQEADWIKQFYQNEIILV